MATVTFDRKEFEKYIPLTTEVQEKIVMFGTPIESLTADTLEIEVYPNRPDVMSLHGFVRAMQAYLGKEKGMRKYSVKAPEKKYHVTVDAGLKEIRPYTACAIVRGLALTEANITEIIALQEKLHVTVGRNRKKMAIGIYPLDAITLPIRFEARSPENIVFTPLESDREMNGDQILLKHPTGREFAHLLAGMKKYPVFVDSRDAVLSMPPIINSHETGRVTSQTTDVFIECSGFHQETLDMALAILVTMLADMGGTIYGVEVIYGKTNRVQSPALNVKKMKLQLKNVNSILGLSLKESDLGKLLLKMGHEYAHGSVKIPAWRMDIMHEIDLIEEVAIAYGYNQFVPEIPSVATIGSESRDQTRRKKIAEILIGLGYLETSSYHLIKKSEAERAHMNGLFEVSDSKTEYTFLRPNLLIPALRTYAENKDVDYPQNIFEIGTVFTRDDEKNSETRVAEPLHLLVASSPGNFTAVKQILSYVCEMVSVSFELREGTHPAGILGRTGLIFVGGKEIGAIMEVRPETLRMWGIKMPVSFFEIDLNGILRY